jgi:hypothetical protein
VPVQAVSRDEAEWFTIDRDYRIVSADTRRRVLEANIGRLLWDAYPESIEVWKPMYDRGWAEGHATGAGFVFGRLYRAECAAEDDELMIRFREIAVLDATTMSSLCLSLVVIQEALTAAPESSAIERPPLRLVPQAG